MIRVGLGTTLLEFKLALLFVLFICQNIKVKFKPLFFKIGPPEHGSKVDPLGVDDRVC